MNWTIFLLVLTVFINHVNSGLVRNAGLENSNRKSYADHLLLRAFPETEQHFSIIHNQARELCQVLKEFRILGKPTDFLCSNAGEAYDLQKLLTQNGVKSLIEAADLDNEDDHESLLSRNLPEPEVRTEEQPLFDAISFKKYNRYAEIVNYLQRLSKVEEYKSFLHIDWSPEKTTFEGRKLPIVKIGNSPLKEQTRAIWIDAGIHAREWIATATATYIIDRLVRVFSDPAEASKPENADLVAVNHYIAPLLNPDGYEYSQDYDRMWRKNRAPAPAGSECRGVDLNRNYDVEGFGIGASTNPCQEVYQGPSRNSEPEVQRATEFLKANRNNIRASLSLHSHGQVILTSWGYKAELPVDNDKLIRFGNGIKEAIQKSSGRNYEVGPAGVIFYAAGGASDDFAKAAALIPYAATIELPGGGNGGNGFILPASEILSVGREIFEALKSVAKDARAEVIGPDPAHRLEEKRKRISGH